MEGAGGARLHSVTMRAARGLLALVLAAAAAGAAFAERLALERFNRTYPDVAGELAPLVYEPLVIRLESPAQTVVVRRNVVELAPLGGGRFRAAVEVELSGKGTLVADLELGGGQPQRMTDEVVLPLQTIAVDAVVSVHRGQGGYRVVAHELPKTLRVDVRSRLVGEILEASNNMNCQLCKYRSQVLGFEAEVGLPQESHHHHVEGIGVGNGHSHDHEHDHHHDHGHGHGHGHGHHHHHHHHPYPHADHPLGPRTLKEGYPPEGSS